MFGGGPRQIGRKQHGTEQLGGNGTCEDFEGSAGRYLVENEPGSAVVLCAVILSGGRGGSKAEMECEEEEKVRCLAHLLSLAGLLGKSVN